MHPIVMLQMAKARQETLLTEASERRRARAARAFATQRRREHRLVISDLDAPRTPPRWAGAKPVSQSAS